MPTTTTSLLLRVFPPFAGGYFLSYLFRTVNAVIAPDLTASVGLTAADLGLLSSIYFLTFALCQLPLGLLLDRFGPRRVQSILLLVAAGGAWLFGLGQDTTALLIGRALIGVGVSGCLMAAFQAFVLWFPKSRLPLANGCIMACGGLGAIVATAPVEALLGLVDWHGLFFGLSLLTLVVAALVFLSVPEAAPAQGAGQLEAQLRGMIMVFRNRLFWRVAPLTMLAQAALLSLLGLWAGPWLRDVAGLDRAAVATYLLSTAVAMLGGYLILGALGGQLQRWGRGLGRLIGVGLGVFLAAQFGLCLSLGRLAWALWTLFGFTGAASILSFALLSQSFPTHLAGRVNTALNLLVFVTAFGCQYGIGVVINLWPATASGGYPVAAYQTAFGLLTGLQALAWLWFLWPARLPTHLVEQEYRP
jgi:predicted MFS family arabinose efflux permease